MKLSKDTLLENKLTSLEDRRMREYQTIWNCEAEIEQLIRVQKESTIKEEVSLLGGHINREKDEIAHCDRMIKVLDDLIDEIENELDL